MMMERGDHSSNPLKMTTLKKKNKRRFSDEQIKSLETIFESESKLEPWKKLQLARELELQPRQVAIWFQNRRARWKTKQLEHNYSILRSNYDSLASQFESLKKERQSLLVQLQKLRQLMGNSTEGESDNGNYSRCEPEPKSSSQQEETCHRMVFCSDNENRKILEWSGQEEPKINMVEPLDGSLTSSENWCSLDSEDLFDKSCTGSQWLDFWS